MAHSNQNPGSSRPSKTQRDSQTQPSRSQPSQSQPSQTQQRDRGEEEEEGDVEDNGHEQDTDEFIAADVRRKGDALVRLALFNEYRRLPLRRDEINKKVLGTQTFMFKTVFAHAQARLKSTFGLEMVELMSRAEHRRKQDEADLDKMLTGLKKKAAVSGSKTYILRSVLHPTLIDAAAVTDKDILEEEMADVGDDDDELPSTYGSIISWSTSDQLGALGFLYVILALILVSGRTLDDSELKKHLKSFRLPLSATIEFAPHSRHTNSTIEAYLATLIKQGYLDKVKSNLSGAAPQATQGKRSRGADAEEGVSYEWKWGSRAEAEVGEQAIALFIAEFMVERTMRGSIKEVSDEEESQASRRRRVEAKEDEAERMLERMAKDIQRAAGIQDKPNMFTVVLD